MTKFRYISLIAALAICSLTSALPQNQKGAKIWSAGFGPSRDVKIRNPKFVWQVWPEGESKITSAIFIINGKVFDATYDVKKKEMSCDLLDSLPAGTYDVLAKIKVDNWASFDKKWSVTIRPDAIQNGSDASSDSKLAVNEYNVIRAQHGFAPCKLDSFLNLAATAHTNYLSLNREGGHAEEPGKPGFTGSEPKDRMNLFGHVGSSWEVVSMGGRDPIEGIRGLWDAPYHRINMMMPGPGIVGASFKDDFFTMDGEGSTIDGIFVSPPNGGKGISPSWRNQEIPDPTRDFPDAETVLGYPVVLNVYGDGITALSILDSKFTSDEGNDVGRYELSSANDNHLRNSVILIPKKPLKANTSYAVTLRLKDNLGTIHQKAWTFRTK